MRSITRIKRHVMTYEECARVGRKHHRDTNFCSVIALAVGCEIAFSRARAIMANHIARRNGSGTYRHHALQLINNMGYEVCEIDISSKTLKTAQRELEGTSGTFFLYTRGHVSCVKNGTMQDWARNDIQPSNKRIDAVYQIIPTETVVRY